MTEPQTRAERVASGAGNTSLGSPGMRLVGCGSALPVASITNDALSARVDTSDEWIRSRTGIAERRICGPDEPLTPLATRAAEAALAHARKQQQRQQKEAA